ncbi:hypothetical protein E2C01_025857 [Portunus trituberculatus]|uniref:Uncharacterized protein n=1 Tax=Portunus trituberculatus TaxID=210409 RepID=A0A5B7EJ31_PORTR|nr:hypothetical protein [Portunus trituberculatus]
MQRLEDLTSGQVETPGRSHSHAHMPRLGWWETFIPKTRLVFYLNAASFPRPVVRGQRAYIEPSQREFEADKDAKR